MKQPKKYNVSLTKDEIEYIITMIHPDVGKDVGALYLSLTLAKLVEEEENAPK